VRGEEHPASRVATGNRGDEVLDPSGDGVGAESANADALLQLDVDPQSTQLFDQIVADLVAARATNRGRLLIGDPL
jgi:hypothetical protein